MSEKLHLGRSYYRNILYDDNENGPIEHYCVDCGDTDVELYATCKWDTINQKFFEWSPGASFGSAAGVWTELEGQWCNTCSNDSTVKVRHITDVKKLAKIAIHKGVT